MECAIWKLTFFLVWLAEKTGSKIIASLSFALVTMSVSFKCFYEGMERSERAVTVTAGLIMAV